VDASVFGRKFKPPEEPGRGVSRIKPSLPSPSICCTGDRLFTTPPDFLRWYEFDDRVFRFEYVPPGPVKVTEGERVGVVLLSRDGPDQPGGIESFLYNRYMDPAQCDVPVRGTPSSLGPGGCCLQSGPPMFKTAMRSHPYYANSITGSFPRPQDGPVGAWGAAPLTDLSRHDADTHTAPCPDCGRHAGARCWTVDDSISTSKAVQPGKNKGAPEDPTITPSELH
jgi:hypothetical protein